MTGFVNPATLDWRVTGRTVGTHYGMGPTTVVGSFIQGTAVFTVTAANGDTIRGEFVTQADPVGNECPEGWDPFSDLDRFTGGTGRFANASGTLNIWGCALIDFTTAAFTISFNASGTISY